MRKLTWSVAVVSMLASCAGPDAHGELVRSGSSLRDGRLGVAGLVRTDDHVRDVVIGITMLDEGKPTTGEQDVLAYCPSSTDCWWAASFQVEGTSVDTVRTRIVSSERVDDLTEKPRELRVSANAQEVSLRPPGEEGVVYLLAFRADAPRFGTSFFTRAGERSRLRYGPALFPRHRSERVRAFFYPGLVPASVGGGSD